MRPRCEHCGLDYSFVDSADGPAFFVMFISGFIVAGSALAVEVLYAPPYWVHALLWGPLILLVTLGPLPHLDGVEVRCLRYRPGQQRRGVVGELTVERDDHLGAVRDRLAGRQAIPYTGR